MPRRPLHELALGGLQRVGYGRPDVRAYVDEQDLLHRQRRRQAHELAEGGRHLRHLGAEGVHDGLLQVLARQPPLLDAGDDRGKVVILQHNVRGILGHVCASNVHGHAHLCLLERGRVVHAVAGHGADVADSIVAVLLVCLHDDLLVDGRDPREDPRVPRGLRPPADVFGRLVVREIVRLGHARLQLRARDNGKLLDGVVIRKLLREDVDALGDGTGRVGMVAGHHDDLDACALCLDHSCVDAILGRVFDAEEPHKLETLHGEVAVLLAGALKLASGLLARGQVPLGDGEHAPGLAHEVLHRLLDDLHGRGVRAASAELEHAVGRPLHDPEGLAALLAVDRQHPLVLRVKRNLEQLFVGLLALCSPDLGLTAVHLRAGSQDGNLCGRPDPAVLALLVELALRAVVQESAERHGRELLARRDRERVKALHAVHDLQALGRDTRRPLLPGHHEVLDAHLALCERPCLVGAEDGNAAEGLNGVNLAHEHIPLDHLLRGYHQRDCHSRQQTLRHLREERRAAVLQNLGRSPRHGREYVAEEARDADNNGHARDDVHKVLDLDLERGDNPRGLDALRDLAQEGAVAGGVDQARGVALQQLGAEKGQVLGLGGRGGLLLRASLPGLGHRLARERRVVDLHSVCAPQDAHVCRELHTSLEEDYVAGHEIGRVNLEVQPVALRVGADAGDVRGRLHLLHCLHLVLGLLLGPPLQHGSHDDDEREDDRRDVVGTLIARDLVAYLLDPGLGHFHALLLLLLHRLLRRVALEVEDQGNLGHNAEPEQDVEYAAEGLAQELEPLVLLLRRRDPVLPVDVEVCACLVLLEAAGPDPALAVRGHLGLEDPRQPVERHRVHQRLVVLLVVQRILGLQLPVALADGLRLDDDGA
mmetsp:Transcript_10941/g.32057  ORF Transcript_10941/g.32057 Transcript_10941/m.32057 type:complete len:878 (+) Transcript_10941:707-3340(+)